MMATIRLPEGAWEAVRDHLFCTPGEQFVFFLARWSSSKGVPVLLVDDVIFVPEEHVSAGWSSMEVETEGVLQAINSAVQGGYCLVEGHNHSGGSPRFSDTDRGGLNEFLPYIWESLPDRPYGATVWGEDGSVYGRFYLPDGTSGPIQSVLVVGRQLRQIVSRDGDRGELNGRFDRQAAWFGAAGQLQLGRFRIGVVGAGGTGAHVIQQLSYLGCRDFVLVDPDWVEPTNMNRLVTAAAADVGTLKVIVGRRLIKLVAPMANVLCVKLDLRTEEALDLLKGVDVVFGCVDNDGARLVMNHVSLAYGIPYIDVATGIIADAGVSAAGGRVAVVRPGGPCLICVGEIDQEEASFFLAPRAEQAERLERGYVTGMDVPAPAVVSLNGVVASMAVTEFAVWVSGFRSPCALSRYDALGHGLAVEGHNGASVAETVREECEAHEWVAGRGDAAGLERFFRTQRVEEPESTGNTPPWGC